MHYPRPPRRPQARRVRFASRRSLSSRRAYGWHSRLNTEGGSTIRNFCLVALALAAIVAGLISSSAAASAGPVGLGSGVPSLKAAEAADPAAEATVVEVAGQPQAGLATPRRRLWVELTAYSASEEEGTAWGITYTGVPARPGTVAVDPAVIPLGSRLRIAGLAGIYRAEDTGGGIRGAHVDVFMESRVAALQFGRRAGIPVELLH